MSPDFVGEGRIRAPESCAVGASVLVGPSRFLQPGVVRRGAGAARRHPANSCITGRGRERVSSLAAASICVVSS